MTNRTIITVIGTICAQGGGLARAIMNDPDSGFTVRVVTHDVNFAKAKKLARPGRDLVAADPDDPDSIPNSFTPDCKHESCSVNNRNRIPL